MFIMFGGKLSRIMCILGEDVGSLRSLGMCRKRDGKEPSKQFRKAIAFYLQSL